MNSKVENIHSIGAEIAFVLESPHIDELFHKYPLAGSAGREMSKYLLDRYDIPLGLVAHKGKLIELLCLQVKPFSIINISTQPLQKEAYDKNKIKPPKDIDLKMKLKKSIESGATFDTCHYDESLNQLKKVIYDNFKKECNNYFHQYKIIVPCGRFARIFCKQIKGELSLTFKLIEEVPHPSRGRWNTIGEDKLREIKKYLKNN